MIPSPERFKDTKAQAHSQEVIMNVSVGYRKGRSRGKVQGDPLLLMLKCLLIHQIPATFIIPASTYMKIAWKSPCFMAVLTLCECSRHWASLWILFPLIRTQPGRHHVSNGYQIRHCVCLCHFLTICCRYRVAYA